MIRLIVNVGFMKLVMYNLFITYKDTPYDTEEGCLSLFCEIRK